MTPKTKAALSTPPNAATPEKPIWPMGASRRSYGTMTYAGLLSYIYADIKADDPRVTTALDWLRANYRWMKIRPWASRGFIIITS